MAFKDLLVRIALETKDLDRDLDQSLGKIEGFGRRISRIGSRLSFGVTAPLTALGAVATRASTTFETAMAGVAKTVEATDEELGFLGRRLKGLSENEIPRSASELAKLAEEGGQLGVATRYLEDFVETTAGLQVATNLADQAGSSVARFANIMGTSQGDFERIGSAVVALGNNSATTESEIFDMGLRLAGAGRIAGLSEGQVLGLAAALSSVGVEAEAGGTAYSRVLATMATATGSQLNGIAAIAGMTAAEFRQSFEQDAAGALLSFVEGLGRVQDEGGNLFRVLDQVGLGNVRIRDALLRSAGASELLRRSLGLGTQAWQENTALQKEAGRFYDTNASRLVRLRNKIGNVASEFGDVLVPAMIEVIDAGDPLFGVLRGGIRLFTALPAPVKATALALVGTTAALGPVLFGLGQMLQVGTSLTLMGKGLAAALGTTGVLGTLGGIASLVVANGPLLLGLGAIVTVGYQIAKNWGVLSYEGGRLADTLDSKLSPALKHYYENKRKVADVKASIFGGIAGLFSGGEGGPTSEQILPANPTDAFALRRRRLAAGPLDRPLPPLGVPGDLGGGIRSAIDAELLLGDIRETRQELRKLQHDAAFTSQGEEAQKLAEKIGQAEARLRALTAAAQRFGGESGLSLLFGGGIGTRGAPSGGFQVGRLSGLVGDPTVRIGRHRQPGPGGEFHNIFRLSPEIEATRKAMGDLVPITEDVTANFGDTSTVLTRFTDGIASNLKGKFDPTQIVSGAVGNLISGGISTLVGAVGGLFGTSPEERERVRVLAANNQQLARLNSGIARLGDALLGVRGSDLGSVRAAAEVGLAAELPGTEIVTFKIELAKLGLTFEDAQQIAAGLGIELTNSIASLEAFQQALQTEFLDQILNDFGTGFSILQRRFSILGTDSAEQFRTVQERLINELIGAGGPFEIASNPLLRGLINLNAENFDAYAQQFFDRLLAGDETLFEDLGDISIEEFISFLEFAGGALEDFGDDLRSVGQELRNVPEGFKYALAVFEATDPALPPGFGERTDPPGTRPDVPGTGLTGGGGPALVVQGDVVIQAEDADSGRRIWDKVNERAVDIARRGGVSDLDTLYGG